MWKLNQPLPIKNSLWLFLPVILVVLLVIFLPGAKAKSEDPTKYWDIRSVDTMKYSRDTAGSKLNDPSFDIEIQTQVQNIATSGANYVAIATPYDEQFYPFLERWVKAARVNHLHVWFRGNFSAWEGWFGYKRGMSLEDHTKKSVEFIKKHPDLFEDGDIFSSCPECENGSFGDPRQTGKVTEYRQFIISETEATKQAFQDINKNVPTNYWSMNLDVAKVIMNPETAQKLGGVVVIDHYVNKPEKLVSDADDLAKKTGAKIMLGEFGAPIPDINGNMTERQQADFLEQALNLASKSQSIIGLNYWVSKGGSTAIWDDSNNPKESVSILSHYYDPTIVGGFIQDEFGKPVDGVIISNSEKQTVSKDGSFIILDDGSDLTLKKDGYEDGVMVPSIASESGQITLIKKDKSWMDNIRLWMMHHINFELP